MYIIFSYTPTPLPHTCTQGLELSGDSVSSEGGGRGELEVSAEVILTGSELVLTNPTSSVTGRALMGLLTVQSAAGVSGGGGLFIAM